MPKRRKITEDIIPDLHSLLEEGHSCTEIKNLLPKSNCSIREVRHIIALNLISFFYITIFLYFMLNDEKYFNVGNLSFLTILFVYVLLEYIKYYFHKITVRNNRFKITYQKAKKTGFYIVLSFLLSIFIIHFVLIIYGAYVFEQIEETFVLSCTLTTLMIIPTWLYGGINFIFCLCEIDQIPDHVLVKAALSISFCTLLGSWLGAFVIPLDWDRPWQQWPIPCTVGALIGHSIGQCVSIYQCYVHTY